MKHIEYVIALLLLLSILFIKANEWKIQQRKIVEMRATKDFTIYPKLGKKFINKQVMPIDWARR